jgi:hypothetical protein
MYKIFFVSFVFFEKVQRTNGFSLFKGLGNQAPYIPLLSQRSRLYLKDFLNPNYRLVVEPFPYRVTDEGLGC